MLAPPGWVEKDQEMHEKKYLRIRERSEKRKLRIYLRIHARSYPYISEKRGPERGRPARYPRLWAGPLGASSSADRALASLILVGYITLVIRHRADCRILP